MTTTLFAIQPLGLGTGQVESLTSYVRRVAAAHRRSPGQLLDELILEPDRVARCLRYPALTVTNATQSISAESNRARLLVRGLIELTGIQTIGHCTFVDRSEPVDPRDGFRQTRAWCPLCLAEDPIPYDRLLWSLEASRVCVIHGRALETMCDACARSHLPWRTAARPMQCVCGASLAVRAPAMIVSCSQSKVVHDWLARMEAGVPCTRAQINNGVRALLRGSNWATVVARSGVAKSTLRSMRSGSRLLSLNAFTHVVVASGQGLDAFLDQPLVPAVTWQGAPRAHSGNVRKPVAPIREALVAALRQPDAALPSLRGFATANGTAPAFLREHCGELAQSLVRRRAAYQRARKAARLAELAALVRSTAQELAASGHALTRRAIELALPREGILRHPALRTIANELVDAHRAAAIAAGDPADHAPTPFRRAAKTQQRKDNTR